MKRLFSFLFVLFSIQFILNGCDNSTDSKATSVSAPSLLSPSDRDSMVSLTPTFKWSGSADKLEISVDGNLNSIIHTAAVVDSQYTIPSGILHNNTLYFWHAGKTSGSTVYWSSFIFSFRTIH